MKYAVFSCKGLGDGLISSILCHNLARNQNEVTLFHPFLSSLQSWMPTFTISSFPLELSSLGEFDAFFFFYENTPQMKGILSYCHRLYPKRTKILNPIASNKNDFPHWKEGHFDASRCFVDNLECYCREILRLQNVTRENGLIVPNKVQRKRFLNRVVLHPTSSREGKNWTKEKYLDLADQLAREGYEPSFVLMQRERELFPELEVPVFTDLDQLASYVAESGWMIGNCSGIGHLASSLGIPTVTICRSRRIANFWRPGWSPGELVTPKEWIPNVKILRLRDRFWKNWISVRAVRNAFSDLVREVSVTTS